MNDLNVMTYTFARIIFNKIHLLRVNLNLFEMQHSGPATIEAVGDKAC